MVVCFPWEWESGDTFAFRACWWFEDWSFYTYDEYKPASELPAGEDTMMRLLVTVLVWLLLHAAAQAPKSWTVTTEPCADPELQSPKPLDPTKLHTPLSPGPQHHNHVSTPELQSPKPLDPTKLHKPLSPGP